MLRSSSRTTTTEPVSIDSSVEVETVATVGAFRDDVLRHMKAMGISQVELARRLESSAAFVSKVLRGNGNLTVATLLKIGKALGVRVSLRLETPETGELASASSEGPAARKETSVSGEVSHGGSELTATARESAAATARELIETLNPEVVKEIGRFVAKAPKRPGRPKGVGVIPDEAALERMADLIIANEVRSERQAAENTAAEDPGHSEKATARRLRRKFAADRQALLAAAKRRRQQQVAGCESENREGMSSAEPTVPSTGGAPSGWYSSLGELAGAADFVSVLERHFELDRAIAETLRGPHILEEIAYLASLSAASAQMTPAWAEANRLDSASAHFADQLASRTVQEQVLHQRLADMRSDSASAHLERTLSRLAHEARATRDPAAEACGATASLAAESLAL